MDLIGPDGSTTYKVVPVAEPKATVRGHSPHEASLTSELLSSQMRFLYSLKRRVTPRTMTGEVTCLGSHLVKKRSFDHSQTR